LKRRVKSIEGLFIDKGDDINAQYKRIKNGTKPLENDDLATKQYTDDNIGKLGDLRKIITQNINRRLTKISSLENKILLYNKRADSVDQIFDKISKKLSTKTSDYKGHKRSVASRFGGNGSLFKI